MFKKKILLGIFGTIICIGGMTLIPIASHKIKQFDTKDPLIEAKIESKFRNLQNKYNPSNKNKEKEKIKTIENSPIITMISIEEAIQKGYTSDTFDLSKNKDTLKIDISEIKPLMDKGLTFDEARVEIVNKK
jgi:predicted PurR-regulated permease PerM